MKTAAEIEVRSYVEDHADRLVSILQDLVRIPSENHAPNGNEQACQDYVAKFLNSVGWESRSYLPTDAPGITSHPQFWKHRNYENRPNVVAKRAGSGAGRSLILSGHIDTVPVGAREWTHPPFGAEVEGNRLYGRGSVDMKCGIATNLFVAEAISSMELSLEGDLTIESVVDEEFGGVNGTLAGRLMGYRADAAIISEPSYLRICAAQRGGRTAHITFYQPNEGILSATGAGVSEQLRLFLNALPNFESGRQVTAKVDSNYAHLANPVPVTVARIHTAAWGTGEASNSPDRCQVELFWQAMPGETLEEIDREFFEWFEALLAANPTAFTARPRVENPIRWLPGSAIDHSSAIVQELGDTAEIVSGERPLVCGIEGPCDMYIFHDFDIPTVLWGARGGNLHHVDEYVEIDSMVNAATVLLAFVRRWCGEGVQQ